MADRDLLIGWLLVLVDSGVSYGYDLRRELHARGVAHDSAVMYRALRQLEADGLLRSRWKEPTAGPRRRVYEITAAGRRQMHAVTLAIADARDAHDRFLKAADVRLVGAGSTVGAAMIATGSAGRTTTVYDDGED
jgi:PadR family transcriptional regulator, regulatory protein PadR